MTSPVTSPVTGSVLAEVDLDVADAPGPPPRRTLLPLAAAVCAVLALVATAGLRSALTDPPAPPRPPLTAWAEVSAVAPGADGEPVADLVVTVANRGEQPLTVTDVAVSGDRVGPGGTDPGVALVPAAGSAVLRARVPLRCRTPGDRQPVDGGVRVRLTTTERFTVDAVPVGVLATPDGACGAAARDLPASWWRPLQVVSAELSATGGEVVLGGVPAGGAVVSLSVPGGELVVYGARPADPARPGQVRVDFRWPESRCTDTSPRIPYGLQVGVVAGGTRQTWYADVGPELARWLLTGRSTGQPDAGGFPGAGGLAVSAGCIPAGSGVGSGAGSGAGG